MVHDFLTWKLLEGFGEGTETFVDELNLFGKYGKIDNLDINRLPASWGDELESATGKITYKVNLDARSYGIKDISFTIERIELSMEIRKYMNDQDDDGKVTMKELILEKEDLEKGKVKIEIGNLPFTVNNLEIEFSEDNDGEPEWNKTKYNLNIGSQS